VDSVTSSDTMSLQLDNQPPAFTKDDIAHFSDKQLKLFLHLDVTSMQVTDRAVSAFWHLHLTHNGRLRNINTAENALITNLLVVNNRTRTRTIATDEYVRDTAAVVIETPKLTIYKTAPFAEVMRMAIPHEGPRRVGDDNLAAFISPLIDIKKEAWISNFNVATVKKIVASVFDAARLIPYARRIAAYLNSDQVFQSLDAAAKNALTAGRRAHWLIGWLNRIPLVDYLILHSATMYHCTTWYRVENGRTLRTAEAPFRTDRNCMEGWETAAARAYATRLSDPDRVKFTQQFPGVPPVLLVERPPVTFNLPEVKTASECRTAIQLAGSLSSNKHVPYFLYSNKGYSGFLTNLGKRVSLFVSLTASFMEDGKDVDIYLFGVGDAPMLRASLDSMIAFRGYKQTYSFIVPRGQYPVIESAIRNEAPRAGTARIYYTASSEAMIDSDKGSTWESNAKANLVFDLDDPNPWAYVGHIYGQHMFGEVDAASSPSITATSSPKRYKPHAYEFGDCSNMRGVLSNCPLTFFAKGYELVKNEWVPRAVKMAVTCHHTSASWYAAVAKQSGEKIQSWFCPIPRYSPMNNWLVGPERANALVSKTFYEEGGLTQAERDLILSSRSETRPKEVVESWSFDAVEIPAFTSSAHSGSLSSTQPLFPPPLAFINDSSSASSSAFSDALPSSPVPPPQPQVIPQQPQSSALSAASPAFVPASMPPLASGFDFSNISYNPVQEDEEEPINHFSQSSAS